MTEQMTIIFLCVFVGVLGLVLVALDRWNDQLLKENKELHEQLRKNKEH